MAILLNLPNLIKFCDYESILTTKSLVNSIEFVSDDVSNELLAKEWQNLNEIESSNKTLSQTMANLFDNDEKREKFADFSIYF